MKTIISPSEAVALAWSGGEYVSAEAISESDIAAAQRRYLTPVIGTALAEALTDGRYESLRNDYAAPALAMFVRAMLQPSMDIRSGQAGAVVQRGTGAEPAAAEARTASLRSVRRRADSLLRRLSDHLDASAGAYPEYDPEHNILRHCSTDGGIVQIF